MDMKPARKPAGDLESAVLNALWESNAKLSVRGVQSRLPQASALAYTTVMTVLDRLYDKGVVTREKDGKAFVYWPALGREAHLGAQAARMLTGLTAPLQRGVLMAFVDSAEHTDPALLDELSALIQARKRQGEP
jgi:predicted transcriptional regulator